jgi:lipoate-protein ligase B
MIPRPAWIVDCGRMAYGDAWALQRALVRDRQEDRIPDVLLLVEHLPVITVGRAGKKGHILVPEDLLRRRGIELYEIERGGDVTYHGPGQLVGYPILDLQRLDEDVVRYVRVLETTLIAALRPFGIAAERLRGYPGVWVRGAKIAAIGVAVKRKVTMHGFALNVDPDLAHFDLINPCGLGKPVTSMARLLGRPVTLEEIRPEVSRTFGAQFDMALEPITAQELAARLGAPARVPPA